jgi:anti-sigma factor RsiW
MSSHLTADEIAAAVAGLETGPAVEKHLDTCVVCRAEVTDIKRLIAERREALLTCEPDWAASARRIMDRIPAAGAPGHRPRSRWLRPVLAVAAVLVLAVGLGVLLPDRPVAPPAGELAVEEILAEMDALLANDSIPGFEIIDPETDDLATFFDNGAS